MLYIYKENTAMEEVLFKLAKDHWQEYLRCQRLGLFNMFDFGNWERFTSLSREHWLEAMSNYDFYMNEYGED